MLGRLGKYFVNTAAMHTSSLIILPIAFNRCFLETEMYFLCMRLVTIPQLLCTSQVENCLPDQNISTMDVFANQCELSN